jgi:hypothetical protein
MLGSPRSAEMTFNFSPNVAILAITALSETNVHIASGLVSLIKERICFMAFIRHIGIAFGFISNNV